MDHYDIGALSEELPDRCRLEYYDVISSTGDRIREAAAAGAGEGLVVLADMQNSGRGRLGRSWYMKPGENIAFSILLKPALPLSKAVVITPAAAVAVRRALLDTTGLDCGIKWPNDIYYAGRKLCGILTECTAGAEGITVILGVGINVHTSEFPEAIAQKAGSAAMFAGKTLKRQDIISAVIRYFFEIYDIINVKGDLSSLKDEYNAALINYGRNVTLTDYNNNNGSLVGLSRGIDSSGRLTVEWSDGHSEMLSSGEIEILP